MCGLGTVDSSCALGFARSWPKILGGCDFSHAFYVVLFQYVTFVFRLKIPNRRKQFCIPSHPATSDLPQDIVYATCEKQCLLHDHVHRMPASLQIHVLHYIDA